MDDAWMGAMTDTMLNIQMDRSDDAWTGAMNDAWMGGDLTGNSCRKFTACFSPILLGIFDGLSADGDEVMDRLPDGLTDESIDV